MLVVWALDRFGRRPTPGSLPKLAMKDGELTAFAEKPEIAKYMAQSVAPKMAEAMGLPPFDMQTGKGFGCAGCHAIEMN